jgi:hypothetical protein
MINVTKKFNNDNNLTKGVYIFTRVHERRNKLVPQCWYPANWILYYTRLVTEETKSTPAWVVDLMEATTKSYLRS